MNVAHLSALAETIDNIPGAFDKREVIAASHEIACRIAGNDRPSRHDYQNAIPEFLKSLPNNLELAQSEIAIMASRTLGVPGLAAERNQLQTARERLAELAAEVAQIEGNQGQRLARIAQLERAIFDASNELTAWQFDVEALTSSAENDIIQFWSSGHPINAPFDKLASLPILERLRPRAVAKIQARIDHAQAELAGLRTQTAPEEPTRPFRGRGLKPSIATEPEDLTLAEPTF